MQNEMCRYKPDTMNIELTTNCPLRCPQCYCSLTGGKNIDLETAKYWIEQGAGLGVKEVMLSGGETLCYPHIYEVVEAAKQYCGGANVALSGYRFTQDVFDRLVKAGVTGIYISLNGSTERINSQTRDGYELAINALRLLHDNQYSNTTINWVMHSNNAEDFPNVVALAEKYGVSSVVILAVKPDSRKMLSTVPSQQQMIEVSNYVKSYRGKTRIYIESCFSPLLALTCDTKLFGNMNVGKNNGCGAGRTTFSVSVDGLLSPCRHLDYYEKYNTAEEYWYHSPIQKQLRELENQLPEEPCSSCRFQKYCRPCKAIGSKIDGKFCKENRYCPLSEQLI